MTNRSRWLVAIRFSALVALPATMMAPEIPTAAQARYGTGKRIVAVAWRMLLTGAVLTLALPVFAHHSFGIFDRNKRTTLVGTVKELQWTNPHCFIQLLVAREGDAQGTQDEWSIEMASPGQLVRGGWKPRTLKPGDKITVVIFPMRDGSKGGYFVSGTGSNGKLGATPR